jgi:hypothetical protein
MLSEDRQLRPNQQEIAASILDGEAVMINLSTGMYYSMDQVGASVWELIAGGRTPAEIAGSISRRYDVSLVQARDEIYNLIEQLLAEGLVLPSDAEVPVTMQPAIESDAPRGRYVSPKLEIYRDVGHLVALDPPMPGLKDLPWKDDEPKGSRSE